MSDLGARDHQMFPVLNAEQLQTAKRFASGPPRVFAAGKQVYAIGGHGVAAWLVLKGTIDVVRRDGLSHEAPITTHGPGQLTGEVNQLGGLPTIAGGTAGPQGCTALPFDPAHLRALMVGSADVGEGARCDLARFVGARGKRPFELGLVRAKLGVPFPDRGQVIDHGVRHRALEIPVSGAFELGFDGLGS